MEYFTFILVTSMTVVLTITTPITMSTTPPNNIKETTNPIAKRNQMIKSMVCLDGKSLNKEEFDIDIFDSVMTEFKEKTLLQIRNSYCSEGSIFFAVYDILESEIADDANITVWPPIAAPNARESHSPSIVAETISMNNTQPQVSVETPCKFPAWDPMNCKIGCFIKKKIEFNKCAVAHYMKQLSHFQGRNSTTNGNITSA